MYLAYIDESGTPSFNDPKNFVLTCLIVCEKNWINLDKEVHLLKRKYYPHLSPQDVELHGTEILQGQNEHKGMNVENRLKIFTDIYGLIANSPIGMLSVIIDKSKIYAHKRATFDVEQWAYRILFERLCKYCEKVHASNVLNGRDEEYCIMIIDAHNPKYDCKLRSKIVDFMKNGTYYTDNKYVIEDPIFTDSKWRTLSQLCDCASFCIARNKTSRGTNEHINGIFKTFYDSIKVKFDTDRHGNIDGCGLVVFPK